MSIKDVPVRVRTYMYMTWAGMGIGALGIIGFILSFSQVGSPAVAEADLSAAIPWGAYAAILAWVIGISLAWFGRRRLNAAVRERKKELAAAAMVELD